VLRYEGTNEDITKRKLLEEQLMPSQKMEAVGLLAGEWRTISTTPSA
jgi:hypothetical protein